MKKILLLTILATTLGCDELGVFPDKPIALFSIEKGNRGLVNVENLSEKFESYTISWGDGEVTKRQSNIEHLDQHQYKVDGTYDIQLTAYSVKKKKSAVFGSPVVIDNTEGTFFAYLTKPINADHVKYYIQNNGGTLDLIGVSSKYYSGSEELPCGSDGGITVNLKPGTYKFVAASEPIGRGYWESEIPIENDKCTVRKLQ